MAATVTLRPGHVVALPLGKLAPDPFQPRKAFDPATLQSLADNLKARGVLQPILVRQSSKGSYTIVDGERRWRAAKLAKLKTVPVMLHQNSGTDVELLVDQVAANNLREQLSAMELARFLRDLRDRQKLTPNDIAAALVKHGLKAMTRKEVEAQLLLTDLPDWATEMIDAGTLDVEAAPAILRGMKIPGIGTALRAAVRQRVDWRGIVKENDAWEAVDRAASDKHADLTRVESYHGDPVHFNHKTRCKGCEHYQHGRGFAVCTNRELFGEHNKEAKAEGLGPGGRRPEKPSARAEAIEQEAKATQREYSIERKAQEYLHCWLLRRMDADNIAARSPIMEALVLWAAARYPGGWGCGSTTPPRVAELFGVDRVTRVAEAWGSLEAFLNSQGEVRSPLIACQILDSLDFAHLKLVAHNVYGLSLAPIWKMDDEYTRLFRKAELVHQLEQAEAPLPEGRKSWAAMSAGDLRAALLEHALNAELPVPAMLESLYMRTDVRGSWGDADETEDDSADTLILDDEDEERAA